MKNDKILCCDNKFIASLDDKGLWVYKAIESEIFKKDTKTLKKKYHDLPRYKLVIEMEDAHKKEVESYLSEMIIQVVKKLKNLI